MRREKGFLVLLMLTLSFWAIPSFSQQKYPKLIRWKKDNSIMVLIPAGEFWMGSAKKRAESPKHKVYLKDFYIDKYEVTTSQYLKFCQETSRKPPYYLRQGIPKGKENHPVQHITWEDADAYCKWAGKRLPSEAEWEKSARGTDGRLYPWGNFWDPSRSNNRTSPYQNTTPVGSFPQGASPYGVMDMAGNVWEWTGDWYKSYPGAKDQFDETGKLRVTRGGAFFFSIDLLRTSARNPLPPDDRSEYNGFRCAIDAQKVRFKK